MSLINYIWLILLAIYIISPRDLHPHIFDDIIAAGAFLYFLNRIKKLRRYSHAYGNSQKNTQDTSDSHLSLNEACKLLGVNPDASWEEVKKAYNEKIVKSHPDKVNHLSEELQEKAKELTLKLNTALDMIKLYKKP